MEGLQNEMADFSQERSGDDVSLLPVIVVARARTWRSNLKLRIGACIILVVAVAVITWVIVRSRSTGNPAPGSSSTATEWPTAAWEELTEEWPTDADEWPTAVTAAWERPTASEEWTTKPTKKPAKTERPSTQGPPCTTASCHRHAKEVLNQINNAVDPCDDFYEFACGGWMSRNPLTANESSVSGFTVLNDDNMEVLKRAMENASAVYLKNTAVLKTIKYYQTCVDTAAVQKQSAAKLRELIRSLGGWSVLSGVPNSLPVPDLIGKVARELNVDTFLGVTVSVDIEDNTRHVAKLTPATLGMGYDYYVTSSSDNIKTRTAYKDYMKSIARLLGGGHDSHAKMMKIYDFEQKLAMIAEDKDPNLSLVDHLEELRRSGRSFSGIDTTIRELSFQSGFSVQFLSNFLNEAFRGIETFSSYSRVQASPNWYFKKLGNFYSTLASRHPKDIDTLKDYVIWRVVDRYVSAMPSQFTDVKRAFMDTILGPRSSHRWVDCINEMMTPLDMPLGLLFVDSHFEEESKQTVVDMTKRIRAAFVGSLENADWMDWGTREAAREKALAILKDIGYPSWIKDPNQLSLSYSMFNVTEGNYFESFKALNSFARLKTFEALHKAVNKDRWMEGPAQVNGYYSPQQNRIVFLAGIIQSPFYIPDRPRYMNYGGIGMVIGHEITHGFDGTGRLFDKNGNVKDWWSGSSEQNFDRRTRCLVRQYSRYQVFGTNTDGQQTLNENIADNGGIKLAYEAYQSWVRDNKAEGHLPGLGLSVDQLFFLGFARPWCSIYKREAALLQLRVDSHTFNKYRVIGSLSNYKKFSDAFACRKGTKMNPYEKCAVW